MVRTSRERLGVVTATTLDGKAILGTIKEELRRRMHQPIPRQGQWLRQVVTGYNAYHAVPTNSRALAAFRYHIVDLWRRTLRRRSQKDGWTSSLRVEGCDQNIRLPRAS